MGPSDGSFYGGSGVRGYDPLQGPALLMPRGFQVLLTLIVSSLWTKVPLLTSTTRLFSHHPPPILPLPVRERGFETWNTCTPIKLLPHSLMHSIAHFLYSLIPCIPRSRSFPHSLYPHIPACSSGRRSVSMLALGSAATPSPCRGWTLVTLVTLVTPVTLMRLYLVAGQP